jgi:Flp pilus assembly protein TadG
MIGSDGYLRRFRVAAIARSACRRVGRSESGSALVEFALAVSFIMALFFGVIQFGYALYTYQFVTEISRDLTRYAMVRGSACGFGMPGCGFTDLNSTLQTYAQAAYPYPGFDMSQLTVTNSWYSPVLNADKTVASWTPCTGSGCNAPGNMIQVTVQYPFLLSIPFWSATTLNVTSSSSLVIAQ